MDWLRENWFWLTVVVLFVAMHAGHGHGHGGHGSHPGHPGHRKRDDSDEGSGDEFREGPRSNHHHEREGRHDQH